MLAQNIVLDANTSFFSPKGTLRLFGETTVNNVYNNNKHYERIGEWKKVNDTIVWGIKDVQLGEINVELFAGISTNENNSVVTIFLDNQEQDLVVNSTISLQDFQSQGIASFNVDIAGTHEVKIKIKSQNTNLNFGEIEKLIISGSAVNGASTWIRRWRPAATHGSFLSNNNINTEISVYKLNILSTEFDSYQVMTTEFGYIGSSNRGGSLGLTGLNFSLWSYGANDELPPHHELSHLIAVGGKGNGFGRYGHEGTGVKPRGFDPFDNVTSPNYSFTIALRKEPGSVYNTYWCYYLDPVTSHWKLYSSGKTFNDNGDISYLNTTGGFLEIVGPPNNSRTGHRTRIVEYKGWRMQNDGSWNVINKLDPAYNSATSLSFKEWAQNSNGDKFIFKSGGFLLSDPDPGIIELSNPSSVPSFLQGSYVDELYEMPADFRTLEPELISANEILLKFNIDNLGTNPDIKLFYGTEYGLTEGIVQNYVIDEAWQEEQSVSLSLINNNLLSIPVVNLTPDITYYYRLRIKNDEGITWSFEADTFMIDSIILSNLEVEGNEKVLVVYPNPTNGELKLSFNDLNIKKIEIYNSYGQMVLFEKTVKKELSLKHLTSGVYYLKIFSSEKTTKIIKIIKN